MENLKIKSKSNALQFVLKCEKELDFSTQCPVVYINEDCRQTGGAHLEYKFDGEKWYSRYCDGNARSTTTEALSREEMAQIAWDNRKHFTSFFDED